MIVRRLVSVVDDDESIRESLPDLLRELGFAAESFASAEVPDGVDFWHVSTPFSVSHRYIAAGVKMYRPDLPM